MSPSQDKTLSTLCAKAALAGVTLHVVENDDGQPAYVLSRWNLTRQLHSLDEVQRWLDLLTGAAK